MYSKLHFLGYTISAERIHVEQENDAIRELHIPKTIT